MEVGIQVLDSVQSGDRTNVSIRSDDYDGAEVRVDSVLRVPSSTRSAMLVDIVVEDPVATPS